MSWVVTHIHYSGPKVVGYPVAAFLTKREAVARWRSIDSDIYHYNFLGKDEEFAIQYITPINPRYESCPLAHMFRQLQSADKSPHETARLLDRIHATHHDLKCQCSEWSPSGEVRSRGDGMLDPEEYDYLWP